MTAIHVARKQLGLDDDTSRDLYQRVTAKRSLREMNPNEHRAVVAELRRLGFKPGSNAARKGLEGPFAKKLQALWIAAWNLGLVENRNDQALLAFVKRQTGIDHVRFLRHADDAAKAIEALKGWMARAGGVEWSTAKDIAVWMQLPGAQIAIAQWQILHRAGDAFGPFFAKFVAENARPLHQMTDADWTVVMNLLGARVRKVRK